MAPTGLVFGIGLVVLGLSSLTEPTWFAVADFIIGGVAIAVAGIEAWIGPGHQTIWTARTFTGIAALVVSIIALATGVHVPLPWFGFAFGIALLATAPRARARTQ